MPSEQGYSSQVTPQDGPGPAQASPDAFGTGTDAALSTLGGTMHAAALKSYQLDRQQTQMTQMANFGQQFAQARVDLDATQAALKSDPNAQPGGVGYVQNMQAAIDAKKQALFSGITERSVQQAAQNQWDSYSASTVNGAQDWANGQRIGKLVTDNATANNVSNSRSFTNPLAYPQELQSGYDRIDALAIPGDEKAKAKLQFGKQNTKSYFEGLVFTHPELVAPMINSGQFDALLDTQDRFSLMRQSGAQLRMRGAQAHAQQSGADAATTVTGEQALATINAGGNLPGQNLGQVQAAVQAAAQASAARGRPDAGLFSLSDRLTEAATRQDVNTSNILPGPTAIAAQNAQAAIDAQVKAGQAVSLVDGARAKALQARSDQLNAQLKSDPLSFATNLGIQLAPLDPAHPASFAQREQQSQQVTTGVQMPYASPLLHPPEAEQYARQAAQGDAGRMQVLAQLDNFSPAGRAAAAKQILPSDGTFATEAQLDPGNRQVVQTGRDLLAKNPGFWNTKDPNDTTAPPPAKLAFQAVDAQINDTMRLISPTDRAGIAQTAKNWLAGFYATQGRADSTGITAQDTDTALRVAMGGGYHTNAQGIRVATGGPAQWGPSGAQHAFVLPEQMTSGDFQNAVYNQVQADRAAGGGPVQLDGKTPYDLKFATPVLTAGGPYLFRAGQNYVKAPNGKPYALKLAPPAGGR